MPWNHSEKDNFQFYLYLNLLERKNNIAGFQDEQNVVEGYSQNVMNTPLNLFFDKAKV